VVAPPEDSRPDPDDLLRQVNSEEKRAGRGKLKIFFGACAGVGKTFAMLERARQLQGQSIDVVVGLLETHGRGETAQLLEGLETLPRRAIVHSGRAYQEFDIDAAIARRPAVLLVDEFAHTNAPGSRHPKRWQDIEELLALGIEVYTTLNVQHLESLNDVVGGITGVRVWETVPDRVFDQANEIVLVDLPADDLLQRLAEGKVYMPEQAERAVRNFFRKGNLIALREIALRRTADRVDDEIHTYRRERYAERIWATRERLLVCVGPAPGSEYVLRSASRLASSINAEWHTVYIETPSLQHLPDSVRSTIVQRLKLAQDLGSVTASLAGNDVAVALVDYARKHNVTKFVMGRTWHRWPVPILRPDLPQRVASLAPDVDIVLVARAPAGPAPRGDPVKPGIRFNWRRDATGYGAAFAACAGISVVLTPLREYFALTNVAMIFLLGVLVVAAKFGRGPAILAAIANVLAFDFFFVAPQFSFAVADAEYFITFAAMLAVGLLTAQLTSNLRFEAGVAAKREQRAQDLYQLARELSAAITTDQIESIIQRAIKGFCDAPSAVLLPDAGDRLVSSENLKDVPPDLGTAQWAYDRGTPAGAGTDTLPGSAILYLPMRAPMRVRGVIAIASPEAAALGDPEQRRLLDTLAALAAIALERVHFVSVAQETLLKIESERLRESLLAALSHDLRTPLTSLIGMAEALAQRPDRLSQEQIEVVTSMRAQATRMMRIVSNLLDLARLESGQTPMRADWQTLEELVGSARVALVDVLRDHSVVVTLPHDLPLLFGDAVLLERVLANLLENAAKHTPKGSRISIEANALDDAIEIVVSDNGPGLPQGREEELFNKFVRAQPESAVPGLGLGLAICRSILTAHGGTIHAENARDNGARFIIRVPRKTMPDIEPESDAAAEPE
jgi:two-component system sensor histidine kinase KdpD